MLRMLESPHIEDANQIKTIHTPGSSHNGHTRLPEFETLGAMIEQKPLRTYDIDSRESTPDIFPPALVSFDAIEYWKDLANHKERLIRALDPSKDYRRSINDANYWKTEARHYEREYWIIQSERSQPKKTKRKKQVGPSKMMKATYKSEPPVSSRTRSRILRQSKDTNAR